MNATQEIQTAARDLLEREKAECVIGYEQGTHGHVRPAFIYKPEDVGRLIWNERCTHNLVRYLIGQEDVYLGIVVKPCDARAINVLLAENKLDREKLFIIGLTCQGIKVDDEYQARCQICIERTPIISDLLIEDEAVISHDPAPAELLFQKIAKLPPDEKTAYWLEQFDQCIRCYACRQACPICSCPTCLYEREDPLWVGAGIGLNEKRSFHLGRAFHLAGRCVGCNECERVCPVDLPISMLNQQLYQEMRNRFGHTAGLQETLSPLTTTLASQEAGR